MITNDPSALIESIAADPRWESVAPRIAKVVDEPDERDPDRLFNALYSLGESYYNSEYALDGQVDPDITVALDLRVDVPQDDDVEKWYTSAFAALAEYHEATTGTRSGPAVTIVNTTPHPIHIYDPADAPGGIVRDGAQPIRTYPVSGSVARLDSADLGAVEPTDGIPTRRTAFGRLTGLPDSVDGVLYAIALPCVASALAAGRTDIIVMDGQVRVAGPDGRPGAVCGATAWGRPE